MEFDSSSGDPLPDGASIIEVHVTELRQLFNAMDPSPFHDRDLDPAAEEFIVDWSKELPRDRPLALLVHLDRSAGLPDEATLLRNAMQQFFAARRTATLRRLKLLFRTGRISLLIGLGFLGGALAINQLTLRWLSPEGMGGMLRESLLIGGWVAMWRPIEVFLYDWWPIRAEAKLFERLAAMPIRVRYISGAVSDAWRRDWPATIRARRSPLDGQV